MLYSSPSQRIHNKAEIQRSLAPPSNLSGSGSTIASLMFTNNNSYERTEDLAEITDGFNLTKTQDYNTHANYENYLKNTEGNFEDTLSYSDTFETSLYQEAQQQSTYCPSPGDEKPIKAAGYYDLNFVEDDYSEFAENNEEELTQVVSLYRNQMRKGRLDTVLEASRESTPSESSKVLPNDKRESMRQQCIEKMGARKFEEVYGYMRIQRQSETPDSTIIDEAKRRWGREATTYCFLVDQLIFVEIFT